MTQADITADGEPHADNQRNVIVRLLVRITIYYLLTATGAALLLWAFPGLPAIMPIGGIAEFYSDPFLSIEALSAAPNGASSLSPWLTEAISLLLAMLITLIAMVPVSWLYKAIHEGHEYDHSIDETALIMPAVVAGVVTVAQHSLALAFSLAGIVAGVRFRRALSDTFDTLFIFVAIGVGLAAGVGSIEIAIVITVFFNYATAVICIFGDGLESKYIAEKELRRIERKNSRAKVGKAKKRKKKDRPAAAATENNAPAVSEAPPEESGRDG